MCCVVHVHLLCCRYVCVVLYMCICCVVHVYVLYMCICCVVHAHLLCCVICTCMCCGTLCNVLGNHVWDNLGPGVVRCGTRRYGIAWAHECVEYTLINVDRRLPELVVTTLLLVPMFAR